MSLMENTLGDKKLWEAGRRYERERIINLLKDNLEYVVGEGICTKTDSATVEDVIALIREEIE